MKHHRDKDPEAEKAKEEHEEQLAEEVLGLFGAKDVIEKPGRPGDEPLGGPADEDRYA